MFAGSSTPNDDLSFDERSLFVDDQRSRQLAFEALVDRQRSALRAMVAARLDRPLLQRVDPSDVVQEGLINAYDRLDEFLQRRPMRFDLWLRKTTLERLIDLRRRHYAACRDVRNQTVIPDGSAQTIAARLLPGDAGDAADAAERRERVRLVTAAMTDLSESDREILLLRYVDQLTHLEAAAVLGINVAAATKRHGRALLKLSRRLAALGLKNDDRSPD